MKKLLLFGALAFSLNVFGQCDEYYINELISGSDDKCYFPEGSPVRFCPDLKGIAINKLTLDALIWTGGIYSQEITVTKNGGMAGDVILKLNAKELVINLFGCDGKRTYSISLTKEEYLNHQKEKAQKQQEADSNLKLVIKKNLEDRRAAEAENNYAKLFKEDIELKKEINTLKRINSQEILSFIQSNSISEAVALYNINGEDENLKVKIDDVLEKNNPKPQTILSNKELGELIKSSALDLFLEIASKNEKAEFNLEISKNGDCVITSNSVKLLNSKACKFKVDSKYIASNTFEDYEYKLAANYKLNLEVSESRKEIVGAVLSKDFIPYKNDIVNQKNAYYYAQSKGSEIALAKLSDGNDKSQKFENVIRLKVFEFSNNLEGRNIKWIYSCPVNLNGHEIGSVRRYSDYQISKWKRFK